MTTNGRLLISGFVCGVMISAASAIEPAYVGPLGNPEEPATRPYKAMYRGLKSFFIQPVRAFNRGNDKVKYVGSLEAIRGVRQGTVELLESTYTGMAGKLQPEPYQLQAVNTYMDDDRRLAALADGLTAAALLHWTFNAPVATVFGSAGYVIVQSEMDISVMTEEEKDFVLYRSEVAKDKEDEFAHPNRDAERYFNRLDRSREIESRHTPPKMEDEGPKYNLSGNLIKKGRRGSLVDAE
jgi:hypothetical protein